MKAIVLAGGSGTRLFPSTKVLSKQLLPVYDKPTIYYPISVMMLAGLRSILIISSPRDIPMVKDLLGDGHELGLEFSYAVQPEPKGISQAFLIGREFINGDSCALILGDNLFYGNDLANLVQQSVHLKKGANVFACHVNDPERYGVVEFDKSGRAISIEEKPVIPKSNWAVTGLYFYDNRVVDYVSTLKPSKRGELEITDLNRIYLDQGELNVTTLGRGTSWLDTGTPESLLSSSSFVQTIEMRQGLKIACLEEISYLMGYIDLNQLAKMAHSYPNCSYGSYLKNLVSVESRKS